MTWRPYSLTFVQKPLHVMTSIPKIRLFEQVLWRGKGENWLKEVRHTIHKSVFYGIVFYDSISHAKPRLVFDDFGNVRRIIDKMFEY